MQSFKNISMAVTSDLNIGVKQNTVGEGAGMILGQSDITSPTDGMQKTSEPTGATQMELLASNCATESIGAMLAAIGIPFEFFIFPLPSLGYILVGLTIFFAILACTHGVMLAYTYIRRTMFDRDLRNAEAGLAATRQQIAELKENLSVTGWTTPVQRSQRQTSLIG